MTKTLTTKYGFKYTFGLKKNTLSYRYQQEDYIKHLMDVIRKLEKELNQKKWWQFWK